MEEPKRPAVDLWLKRILLIALSALAVAGAALMAWMLLIAIRVEQALVTVSHDVETVTGAVAKTARDLDRLRERVTRIESKAEQALGVEDFEKTLDEAIRLRRAEQTDVAPSAEAEDEIRCLLRAVRDSDCEFVRSGKRLSAARMYAALYAKYLVFRGSLHTPEEFIENVATKRLTGDTYGIIRNGATEPLDAFLREKLAEYRAAHRPGAAAPP